jgi:hypothetical protein
MQGVRFIKGKLVGPKSVELDEPVSGTRSDVEVIVRTSESMGGEEAISEFLRQLPPGKRTKDEIDKQIQEERDSWGNGK